MPKRGSDVLPDRTALLKRIRTLEREVEHMKSDSDSEDSSCWPIEAQGNVPLEDSDASICASIIELDEEKGGGESLRGTSSSPFTTSEQPPLKKELKEESISEDILKLLGNAPTRNSYGNNIHPELCSRVNQVLMEGLEKDERRELLDKHKFPKNCRFIGGAKLNPEIEGTLSHAAISRDGKISSRQDQIGAAIAAVLSALDLILKEGKKEVITPLIDATKLLSDVQNQEAKLRRKIILPSLDKKLSKFIEGTIPVDDFLFGKDLETKINRFKNVGRLGANIKPKHTPKNYKILNPRPAQQFKGPPHQESFRNQRPQYRAAKKAPKPSPQHFNPQHFNQQPKRK